MRVIGNGGAQGSPAHAGIDPKDEVIGCARMRFPRTRGDRPIVTANIDIAAMVPPHTRG